MEWFRMYAEFASDPKVQMMPEAMQRRLVMLFCLRCSNVTVTLHDDEVAFALRISEQELAETKALFLRKGFINEDFEILNWEKRQSSADSSAARVARHRARQKELKKEAVTDTCNECNVTVTVQNRIEENREEENREEKNIPRASALAAPPAPPPSDPPPGLPDADPEPATEPRKPQPPPCPAEAELPFVDPPADTQPPKRRRRDEADQLIELGVEPQVARDWLALRASKRLKLTPTALDGVRREVERAGMTLDGALRICCVRGWGGFQADWVLRDRQDSGGRGPPTGQRPEKFDPLAYVNRGFQNQKAPNERPITIDEFGEPV